MALILKPILKVTADSAMKVGIPIPLVENITIANHSLVTVLDGVVRIDTDLLYVNKTQAHAKKKLY